MSSSCGTWVKLFNLPRLSFITCTVKMMFIGVTLHGCVWRGSGLTVCKYGMNCPTLEAAHCELMLPVCFPGENRWQVSIWMSPFANPGTFQCNKGTGEVTACCFCRENTCGSQHLCWVAYMAWESSSQLSQSLFGPLWATVWTCVLAHTETGTYT